MFVLASASLLALRFALGWACGVLARAPSLLRAAKPSAFAHFAARSPQANRRWALFQCPHTWRCRSLQPVAANYSVKWTAANRRGIFMQLVAAATYLKR